MENTEIWMAKGKAMDTNTGESPGYQSLETHLLRKVLGTGDLRALIPWSNG